MEEERQFVAEVERALVTASASARFHGGDFAPAIAIGTISVHYACDSDVGDSLHKLYSLALVASGCDISKVLGLVEVVGFAQMLRRSFDVWSA